MQRIWRVTSLTFGACLATIVFSSCASNGDAEPESGASTSAKSRTILGGDIPFRGRWWSYYERGREHADEGNWTMARRDFETAINSRSGDQLWARTYGMHFMSEYFPSRELGIALYYEGLLDDSEAALMSSQEQQPSARAEFFLNEIRRSRLSADGDLEPPAITIIAPTQLRLGGTTEIKLAGEVTDDTFVETLTINGALFDIREAQTHISFSHMVDLVPGINTITLVTRDLAGKTTTKTMELHVDLDGPVIVFDESATSAQSVQGVVIDPAGVESVTINGQPAVLGGESNERRSFRAERTAGAVDFEARDQFGNITAGALRSTTLETASARRHALHAQVGPLRATYAVDRAQRVRATFADAVDPPIDRPKSKGLIRFENPPNGKIVGTDFENVTLEIAVLEPGQSIRLNDVEVPLHGIGEVLPIAGSGRVSRAVRLGIGINDIEAKIVDAAGQPIASDVVRVHRELTALEDDRGRLSAALIGNIAEGRSREMEGEAAFVQNRIGNQLERLGRFNLVDRNDLFAAAVTEQQLDAMLKLDGDGAFFRDVLLPEVVFVGRIRRDFDVKNIEIVVQAISTESLLYLSRADVAGVAETADDLEPLLELLMHRIAKDFQRHEGEIMSVRGAARVRVKPRIAVPKINWLEASPQHGDAVNHVLNGIERELFGQRRRVLLTDLESTSIAGAMADPNPQPTSPANAPRAVDTEYALLGELVGNGILRGRIVEIPSAEVLERFDVPLPADREAQIEAGVQLARQVADWLVKNVQSGKRVAVSRAFNTSLGGALDGYRESMKLIVYRRSADTRDGTGIDSQIPQLQILGEAVVSRINNDSSIASLLINSRAAAPQLVREGDFVIVK